MHATFLDEGGKPQLLQMGCYGIGITRILGAAIEQNHDERGIDLAGADRAVRGRGLPDRLRPLARRCARPPTRCIADCSSAGVDAILDDRGERPGAMFADWELIGVPHRVVLSDRGLKDGEVEYQGRRDAAATAVPPRDGVPLVKGKLAA